MPCVRGQNSSLWFSERISYMNKELIPNHAKMGFYCVAYNQNCTYEKTGRGGYSLAAASRLFFLLFIFRIVPFIQNSFYLCD